MATKQEKTKQKAFDKPYYSVMSKEFCKGLVEISEEYIKLSKTALMQKEQLKYKLSELAKAYPFEYKKLKGELAESNKLIKEERQFVDEDIAHLVTRTSPAYFLEQANIAKANIPMFEKNTENIRVLVEFVGTSKEDMPKLVDYYHSACINYSSISNTKRLLKICLQKAEEITNKKGYAEEPKTKEEYEQLLIENNTKIRGPEKKPQFTYIR